jgi:hypothetical protein
VERDGGLSVGIPGRVGAEDELAPRRAREASSPIRIRTFTAGIAGHGLGGVEHEVEHGLLDELDIEVGQEGGWGQIGSEADATALSLGCKEIDQLVNDDVDVGADWLDMDAPGEGEEILEDPAEALDLAPEGGGAADDARPLGFGDRKVGGGLGEELGVEADGGEGVLDLVGEPAGHGADFSQAFGRTRTALGCMNAPEVAAAQKHSRSAGQQHAQQESDR